MDRCKECGRPRITPATFADYRDAPEDSVCWRDYPSPGADTHLAECLRVALGAARAEVRAAGERADAMERLAAMAQRFFDGEWYVEPYKGGWWVWRMRGIEDAEFLSGSRDRLYPSLDAAFAALAAARAKEGAR